MLPPRPPAAPRRALRALTALLLLAAALLFAPAATAHAATPPAATDRTAATATTAATAGASGAGWNDYACKPSAAHPRPVVLVHGTFGNSVDNWLGLAPYLVRRGYCVFSLDYGQLPGVPFFHGLGPVAESAGQLDAYVDRVLGATGAREVDIVGHSQGGMMPRHYLKFLGGAEKVNALVGIAPDNHGTTLHGLTRLLPHFPGAADLISAKTPALADQIAGSPFLQRLNEGGDTVPGVRYTVIATRYDQVVTPYRSSFLDGPNVRNVLLQDLCPLDLSEHLAIGLVDRIAFHEVANALDPARATPTTCASVLG
ncbi:esterase/lipase family protein [Streptomyces fradiae]|uniref:esterase/lipase family protein n=1 Tax=Streptomyces TaxID=1883 RepID=UPI002019F7A5|nr:alpha/beta fold hydrolase [Streptomyces fradiae]UQS28815.1 alpha/beta fold hydrolase [Streptomyces fradiae]